MPACVGGGRHRITQHENPCPDACVYWGRWALHTRAHPTSTKTAESCGTALSVAVMVGLPCAQTPLTAHGNPTATHHDHQESPSFQQKPAPTPQMPQSPMCNTNDNHTHQAHHTPHNQPTTNPNRNSTDLDASLDRSRHGFGPISTRSTTDLEAEPDRSRRSSLDTAQRRPIEFSGSTSHEVQADTHHHGRNPEHDEGRQVT